MVFVSHLEVGKEIEALPGVWGTGEAKSFNLQEQRPKVMETKTLFENGEHWKSLFQASQGNTTTGYSKEGPNGSIWIIVSYYQINQINL